MTVSSADVNTPIDERIFLLVSNEPTFTFKDVRALFPQESDKTLYRAVNKLEAAGRIRFLHWNRKQKVYSCAGVSKFPVFLRDQGNFDLVTMMLNLDKQFDEHGNYIPLLDGFNDMYLDICRLFLVVDAETEKELADQYIILHQKLTEYKRRLAIMQSDVDAVLMHATMRGDLNYFKKIYTSNDAPSPQDKLNFKVLISRVLKKRENNE